MCYDGVNQNFELLCQNCTFSCFYLRENKDDYSRNIRVITTLCQLTKLFRIRQKHVCTCMYIESSQKITSYTKQT